MHAGMEHMSLKRAGKMPSCYLWSCEDVICLVLELLLFLDTARIHTHAQLYWWVYFTGENSFMKCLKTDFDGITYQML